MSSFKLYRFRWR